MELTIAIALLLCFHRPETIKLTFQRIILIIGSEEKRMVCFKGIYVWKGGADCSLTTQSKNRLIHKDSQFNQFRS